MTTTAVSATETSRLFDIMMDGGAVRTVGDDQYAGVADLIVIRDDSDDIIKSGTYVLYVDTNGVRTGTRLSGDIEYQWRVISDALNPPEDWEA